MRLKKATALLLTGMMGLSMAACSNTGNTKATTAAPKETAAKATTAAAEPATQKATEAATVKETEKATEAATVKETEKATEAATVKETEKATEAATEKETEKATEAASEKETEAESEAEKETEAASAEETEEVTEAQTEEAATEQAATEAETEAETENETEELATEALTEDASEADTESATEEDLGEIKTITAGKLTVATSPDFAPYEFYAIDENGEPQLAGFDIALAGYIADYLDLELEIIPIDFDGVLMELQTKSVDLGVAGLSADPKRDAIMDFSDIYYKGGQSFVCLNDNKDLFKTLEDVNNKDYEIGAQTGSIQVDLAQTNSPDADIIQLAKVTDIIAELLAGKLDGAYIETAVAQSYATNYPELYIALDVPYEASEGSAVGVSKGNAALLAGVNKAINAAIEDGSMDKFVAEANELASGEIIEGLLEDQTAEETTEAE